MPVFSKNNNRNHPSADSPDVHYAVCRWSSLVQPN